MLTGSNLFLVVSVTVFFSKHFGWLDCCIRTGVIPSLSPGVDCMTRGNELTAGIEHFSVLYTMCVSKHQKMGWKERRGKKVKKESGLRRAPQASVYIHGRLFKCQSAKPVIIAPISGAKWRRSRDGHCRNNRCSAVSGQHQAPSGGKGPAAMFERYPLLSGSQSYRRHLVLSRVGTEALVVNDLPPFQTGNERVRQVSGQDFVMSCCGGA